MVYEVLEISWISSVLFFAFSQAIGALVLACAPTDIDKAIEYFEWILRPLNTIIHVSFFSLVFATAMTWVYFLSIDTIGKYEVPIAITIFGVAVYVFSNKLMSRILQSRIRPEYPN